MCEKRKKPKKKKKKRQRQEKTPLAQSPRNENEGQTGANVYDGDEMNETRHTF